MTKIYKIAIYNYEKPWYNGNNSKRGDVMLTCQVLKKLAKRDMHHTKPSVFKASILYFVIAVIISLLVIRISGYDRFITNLSNIAAEINQKPEMLTEPTEEFINEVYSELETAMPKISPAAACLVAVLILMNNFLNIGFQGYCLKVCRKQETRALDIMCGFEHFGKALIISVIVTVCVAVGSMLFVIPGIIAACTFSQCYMIMFDHPEYSALRCLKESAKMMKGRKIWFFILQFSFIAWIFVSNLITSLIGVGVLEIYLKPYMGLAQAHFYNEIVNPDAYKPKQPDPSPQA